MSWGDFLATTLQSLYSRRRTAQALEDALDGCACGRSLSIRDGYRLLILCDRGMDKDYAPIPSLLALTAVHNHLVRERTRTQVALIIESGEPREVMHFALLIGYGASAINPYLAIETLEDMSQREPPGRCALRDGAQELQEVHQQGTAQSFLEDGHLDAAKLSRRAGLRGHRPEPGADRPVFHGNRFAHRRRGPGCSGARSADEARARVPPLTESETELDVGRQVSIPRQRRISSAESADGCEAAARGSQGPRRRLRDLPGIRRTDRPSKTAICARCAG